MTSLQANEIATRRRTIPRINYHRVESWPSLAWLAHCRTGSQEIDVMHGTRVEVTPDFFCEAVWDGPFEAGDFDRTDVVCGSGGRLRDGALTFVSAGHTVDRLQLLARGDEYWISNSLTCLLSVTGARVDPAYPNYFRDFSTIRFGLARYVPTLATSAGDARLVYFDNIVWDGKRLDVRPKPELVRDFSSFEGYRGFLDNTLQRVALNLGASFRRYPLRMLGTISSGYDSSTVAVLCKQIGLSELISFEQGQGDDSDSGHEIAACLGLNTTLFHRDAWRRDVFPEVPFLAADAKGEDVFLKGAERVLEGSVLFTGHYGGKVWCMETTGLGPDFERHDQSGLSLTEYRLQAGFLHCPVPYFGARQIGDLSRISRSPALARWDVGGRYSKPIARRIVEEAGVPRTAFGIRKKASSVLFFHAQSFLTPAALAEYVPWLESHVPPPARGRRSLWDRMVRGSVARAAQLVASTVNRDGPGGDFLHRAARYAAGWADHEPLFRWVFPWASERARATYPPPAVPVS
ncbi:MAG TPA: hypothetical protein VFO67_04600 [Gemmatimonadales bacterium]|nr:hypothetical protein [Gemmatimonadales bacterium]